MQFRYYPESQSRGGQAEVDFLDILKSRGFHAWKGSDFDDLRGTDIFFVGKNDQTVGVDVKAMKRISRRTEIQDDLTAVEFQNVIGEKGWLYHGAALLAFERERDFILINKEVLLAFCLEKVNRFHFVSSPHDALYKVYMRTGRQDIISMIRLTDLPEDKVRIWPKIQ